MGSKATELLQQIPAPVPLWETDAEGLIKKGGPADTLWELLEDQPGIGWVTAGKLLARKRPFLIPVYDDVVRCAFDWPKDIWQALRAALREDNGRFRATVEDLMTRARVPSGISPLRALDVVLWMHHHPCHTGYRCSGIT